MIFLLTDNKNEMSIKLDSKQITDRKLVAYF